MAPTASAKPSIEATPVAEGMPLAAIVLVGANHRITAEIEDVIGDDDQDSPAGSAETVLSEAGHGTRGRTTIR